MPPAPVINSVLCCGLRKRCCHWRNSRRLPIKRSGREISPSCCCQASRCLGCGVNCQCTKPRCTSWLSNCGKHHCPAEIAVRSGCCTSRYTPVWWLCPIAARACCTAMSTVCGLTKACNNCVANCVAAASMTDSRIPITCGIPWRDKVLLKPFAG